MENRRPANEANLRRYKEQNEKLQSELQLVKHERDNILMKMERMGSELDSLKHLSNESSKLKMKIEELQQVCLINIHWKIFLRWKLWPCIQENTALKVSLEASDRIRKQQKEFISTLQRSQSFAESSAASVTSMNSYSSQTVYEDISVGRSPARKMSIPEENRSWLNSSPQRGPTLVTQFSRKLTKNTTKLTTRPSSASSVLGVHGSKPGGLGKSRKTSTLTRTTNVRSRQSEYSQKNMTRVNNGRANNDYGRTVQYLPDKKGIEIKKENYRARLNHSFCMFLQLTTGYPRCHLADNLAVHHRTQLFLRD